MRFSVAVCTTALWIGTVGVVPAQPAPGPATSTTASPSPAAGASAEVGVPKPPTSTQPWVSRQVTFNIPFSVDLSRSTPTEVQLFVSQDAGRTWHFYSKQAPSGKHFAFRAAADGEYWFSSRTIDPQRNVPRVEQLQPELHVVVDTQQPRFEFTALLGVTGDLTAAWKITDPTLTPQTLKIEYQTAPDGAWKPVSIDRTRVWESPGSSIGEMTWRPEGEVRALNLRAEIADAAGNKSVVSRQVTRAGNGNFPVSASVPPDPYVSPFSGTRPTAQPTANAPVRPTASPGATNWPADPGLTGGPTPNATSTSRSEVTAGPTDPSQSVANPHYAQNDLGTTANYPPVPGQTLPRIADQVTTPSDEPANQDEVPAADSAAPGLPTGERPRMTNSLHFQLEYELDAVGPQGVDELQLWGTKDYGQTWSRWLIDADKQSPFDVQVDAEGTYGFRIVIVGRNGLATPEPHPGELADVWVGVDTTKPAARITNAAYGEGLHAGELDIRWHAADPSLSDRAITLSFSVQAAGEWTTIAAGLPNSGQYYWRLDPNMPREIFLRLEVHDDAGNVAEHRLVEPISTAGLIPKAHIRAVRPLTETPPAAEANRGNRFYFSR